MVTLESTAEVKEVERDSEKLGARVAQELMEIVKEADRSSDLENAEPMWWLYRVPFPGVRYYEYKD